MQDKIRYVVDTTSIISYFKDVFKVSSKISSKAIDIIENAFNDENIILFIPSIVFVEIFSKWFKDEEFASKIRYNVYEKLRIQENISIEPFDKEVLENFIKITDFKSRYNFDNHDKQILATAMKYNSALITSDKCLIKYNRYHRVIPCIIS